jgi:hypothetical protein
VFGPSGRTPEYGTADALLHSMGEAWQDREAYKRDINELTAESD